MASISVNISNCNNVVNGHFLIEKDILNIKYGMNGTGKSTIATALELLSKQQPLTSLKTFGAGEGEDPTVTVSEPLGNVLIFNEDFVNTLVFQENSFIENAFNVFIKTPDYDQRRASLDSRLKALKVNIGNDERVIQLRQNLQDFAGKLELTAAGTGLKLNTNLKAIIRKENLFNIPVKLQSYSPFISDDSISINWIDWKTKGETFDNKEICPFCSDNLKPQYQEEKQIFSTTYKKADSQNLKNMLDLFQRFEIYLDPSKFEEIISCIKKDVDEQVIKGILTTFMVDFNYLKNQLDRIAEFDSNVFRDINIKDLDKQLESLKINKVVINLFSSPLTNELIDFVNSQIEFLGAEAAALKADMGTLRSLMQDTIRKCQNDMNLFLNSAGIEYEVIINVEDDGKTAAVLKYRSDADVIVDRIRTHLSWGERNAFALILFMFHALSQNPGLIILDDPISSFDSNKKYAIIHRLFAKVQNIVTRSFYRKTVLMLTHDFEPIIDFVVVGKLPPEYVSATFIKNNKGTFVESIIDTETHIRSVIKDLLCHIHDNSLNMVHRITFLRKYYEHHGIDQNMDAYDILSSLIHGRENPTQKDQTPLSPNAVANGTNQIKQYLFDFEYAQCIQDYFNEQKLVEYYFSETNSYLKLHLFRSLMEIVAMPEIETEDTLIKFINESYHIENDYAYYLDLIQFDMIPSYIVDTVDNYMAAKYNSEN